MKLYYATLLYKWDTIKIDGLAFDEPVQAFRTPVLALKAAVPFLYSSSDSVKEIDDVAILEVLVDTNSIGSKYELSGKIDCENIKLHSSHFINYDEMHNSYHLI